LTTNTDPKRKWRIQELAEAVGIKNPHSLHLKTGKSYRTIKDLWDNTADNATYDTLKAISEVCRCKIEDLELLEEPNERKAIAT
jgi:DNA-binding Xre family transcriptional regulator